MYEVIFYYNHKDTSEIELYLQKLQKSNTKSDRTEFNKITAYINKLEQFGLSLRLPYIRPLTKELWELRPLDNRIIFAYYKNNQFVLLSLFKKRFKKTPKSEIKRAKKYLKNFIEGSDENEKL